MNLRLLDWVIAVERLRCFRQRMAGGDSKYVNQPPALCPAMASST
ncbi:hypothetical protein ACQFN5_19170 [Klebsiella sp. WOUb02]